MKKVPLSGLRGKGLFALIDDEDFDLIKNSKWSASKKPGGVYAVASIECKFTYLHRLIMKPKNGKMVDHINGDTLDNRKSNLRFCTRAENLRNSKPRKNTSSRFKGVAIHKMTGRWQASISCDNKRIYIGLFHEEIDAAKAYNKKAKKLFGNFARVNKEVE